VLIIFEKFGNFVVQHLDYCSHCLFVASSKVLVLLRLTYIIHIVFQIYPKSNSLQILSLDSGGAETPKIFPEILGFLENPDLARSIRTFKV
jgi:hypothetical protein